MPEKHTSDPQNWRQQIIGSAIGALIIWLLINLGELTGWHPANRNAWILSGAAIGGLLNDLERIDKAGSRLTRRESAGDRRIATLNIIVALIAITVLFTAMLSLIYFIGTLI